MPVPQSVAAMRAALPLAHAAMREPGPGHGIRPGPGAGGARRRALIVTRVLAVVATCRLAMSAGRQAALAGTVIGPSLQASQTPVTSVAPVRERAIRRHCTLSGAPRRRSWMLAPHEVAVSTAVALTCVAGFVPDSVTPAGCVPGSVTLA